MGKKYSKYELYEASVQDSEGEIHFFQRAFQAAFGKKPVTVREDFCSTFLNSITWVKKNKENVALAVDINPTPLDYGKKNHFPTLKPEQLERIHLFQANVLNVKTRPVDLITISNFSICFIKEREKMLEYFKNCYKNLKNKGAVIFDLLGGEELADKQEDKTPFKLPDGTKATYFWEHDGFNPINHEAKFYIHYQVKGQKKMKRVFSYNWRMWSLPEFTDLLKEAGFSDVQIYWEDDDPKTDGGSGIFRRVSKAESCPIWIAYVIGIKK
jgi:SAM-dependent methyltransferase